MPLNKETNHPTKQINFESDILIPRVTYPNFFQKNVKKQKSKFPVVFL